MILSTGLHAGTSFEEYEKINAANNSSLTKLDQSPAHMIAYRNEPTKRTEAFHEGHAIHYALLEPDEFKGRYAVGPPGDRRTKDVKAEWTKLRMKYGHDFVLSPKSDTMIRGITDAVDKHSIARPLLSGRGETEVVAVWDDPASKVRCKARIDCMPDEKEPVGGLIPSQCIVDIKSCQDASPEAFAKSVYAYNYFRQAQFYLRGCNALGHPRQHFVIIAIEKDPPFGIGVYSIDAGALDAGEQLNDQALAQYAECTARAKFPSYPERVEYLTLPSWAWASIDNRLTGIAGPGATG
jgi:exodeoxyribonuclease VIII